MVSIPLPEDKVRLPRRNFKYMRCSRRGQGRKSSRERRADGYVKPGQIAGGFAKLPAKTGDSLLRGVGGGGRGTYATGTGRQLAETVPG
jgi:hypothetical protein